MRDSYKSYTGEEFDTLEEWLDSLDDDVVYDLIVDFVEENIIFPMSDFDLAFDVKFKEMGALETVEWVSNNLRKFNTNCAFWGEDEYGNLVADDDPLWLAECCGLNVNEFFEYLEDNFDDLVEYIKKIN